MNNKKKLSPSARRAFVEEFALTRLAMRLSQAIEKSGKRQRDIANELGVSEARVSQVLAVTGNPTLRTLARLADAVGCELDIQFAEECHVPEEQCTWQVFSGESPVPYYAEHLGIDVELAFQANDNISLNERELSEAA